MKKKKEDESRQWFKHFAGRARLPPTMDTILYQATDASAVQTER